MTTEEALKILDTIPTISEQVDALEMAIKSLEQIDVLDKIRAEIMSKDGLEEALEIIDKYKAESEGKALEQQPDRCDSCIHFAEQDGSNCYECVKSIVDNFEAPQPKTGHWIFDEIIDKHYYCSECKSMGVDYWDYCPNCGAKMEGEHEDSN